MTSRAHILPHMWGIVLVKYRYVPNADVREQFKNTILVCMRYVTRLVNWFCSLVHCSNMLIVEVSRWSVSWFAFLKQDILLIATFLCSAALDWQTAEMQGKWEVNLRHCFNFHSFNIITTMLTFAIRTHVKCMNLKRKVHITLSASAWKQCNHVGFYTTPFYLLMFTSISMITHQSIRVPKVHGGELKLTEVLNLSWRLGVC